MDGTRDCDCDCVALIDSMDGSVGASTSGSFTYPPFYSFPPHFTLQPVRETRDKQSALWGALILDYCRHHKIYLINAEEEAFAPFSNVSINRKLTIESRKCFLDDLVQSGNAEWLDKTTKRQCLVLWKKINEWANIVLDFAKTYGLADSVMTLDELSQGDDVRGTELKGLNREILARALKLLEQQGRVRLFQGTTPGEEGVKFL